MTDQNITVNVKNDGCSSCLWTVLKVVGVIILLNICIGLVIMSMGL